MEQFNNIPQNNQRPDKNGNTDLRAEGVVVDSSLVREERVLNFELGELLDFACRIMEMDDNDGNKWIGLKNLIEMMQKNHSGLIHDDTCVCLNFEDERLVQKKTSCGPYNYHKFIEALRKPEASTEIHEYINDVILHSRQLRLQRETFFAEDQVLLLYSALRYELWHHERFANLLKPEGPKELGTEEICSKPHFEKNDSEAGQRHWEHVYARLLQEQWLRSDEVTRNNWVYVCCGKGVAPDGRVIWHGTTAVLAYIVREVFRDWYTANQVFRLDKGPLPESFSSTKKPSKKAIERIEYAFFLTNSYEA